MQLHEHSKFTKFEYSSNQNTNYHLVNLVMKPELILILIYRTNKLFSWYEYILIIHLHRKFMNMS